MKRIVTTLLGIVLIMGFFLCADAAQTRYEGVDVSEYQGDIDFEKVRASGVELVYIRAGAGLGYEDRYFRRNAEAARAAGLSIGFYYSMTAATVDRAQEQARFFARLLAEYAYEARPALDYNRPQGLSVEAANANALAFLDTLADATGRPLALYTDAYGARAVWSQAVADRTALWVAEYGVEAPDIGDKWADWAGFQYTDQGRVDGIEGLVDRDQFTAGLLLTPPSPAPSPTGRPSTPPSAPPSTPPSASPSPSSDPARLVEITVRRGDTLSRIARRYDSTVAALMRLNEWPDPDLIYAGQELYVRTRLAPTLPEVTGYTVRRGDTLSRIAYRFSTTVAALAAYNDIANPDRIWVGQLIRLE